MQIIKTKQIFDPSKPFTKSNLKPGKLNSASYIRVRNADIADCQVQRRVSRRKMSKSQHDGAVPGRKLGILLNLARLVPSTRGQRSSMENPGAFV